jgi:hypothetical protein
VLGSELGAAFAAPPQASLQTGCIQDSEHFPQLACCAQEYPPRDSCWLDSAPDIAPLTCDVVVSPLPHPSKVMAIPNTAKVVARVLFIEMTFDILILLTFHLKMHNKNYILFYTIILIVCKPLKFISWL